MAYIVSYDSKQQLAGALERGEKVRAQSTSTYQESGYLDVLCKELAFVTVTNRERSFFAQISYRRDGTLRVQ